MPELLLIESIAVRAASVRCKVLFCEDAHFFVPRKEELHAPHHDRPLLRIEIVSLVVQITCRRGLQCYRPGDCAACKHVSGPFLAVQVLGRGDVQYVPAYRKEYWLAWVGAVVPAELREGVRAPAPPRRVGHDSRSLCLSRLSFSPLARLVKLLVLLAARSPQHAHLGVLPLEEREPVLQARALVLVKVVYVIVDVAVVQRCSLRMVNAYLIGLMQ